MVERNKELIERFEETFLSNYSGLCSFDNYGNISVNIRVLYGLVYSVLPRVTCWLRELEMSGLTFVKGSISENDEDTVDEESESKLSYVDTCEKLGVEFYARDREGIYITNIGIIVIRGSAGKPKAEISGACILSDTDENARLLSQTFLDNIVFFKKTKDKNKAEYRFVKEYCSKLLTERLSFDKIVLNLSENYNDDLPYEDIVSILQSSSNELILFDGKPGTGKTSLIKHLIGELNEKAFYYLDSSILMTIAPSKFMDFMIEHRDSIIVLEDCEKLLSKREQGNPFMGTLLNLTDGIIGESIRAKFICSFNCSENKIDEALLREGRLSLKYTFKELSLEKTKNLVEGATKPMTLAQIYKKSSTKIVGKAEQPKIGFK